MMSCVRSVVVVTPQAICGRVIRSVRNENGTGSSSPACISRLAQSIEGPARRAGVPVLRRPIWRPSAAKRSASLTAGGAPKRPAAIRVSPMWMRPRRNVPVVTTTAPAVERAAIGKHDAGYGARPTTVRSSTPPSMTVRPGVAAIAACIAWR